MEPLETPGIDTEQSWRNHWRRMARLSWHEIRDLLTTTVNNWYEHNVPRLGASLTFYTLLSLAPLLVIVVAIASAFFGRAAAEGQLVWQIRDLIGTQGAETVQALLQAAQNPGAGILASVLGAVTLFFGATAVVAELRDALNTIWCVPRRQTSVLRGLVAVLLDRTLAFATVMGLGFLLLVSLAVSAALAAAGKRYELWLPVPDFVLSLLETTVSFFVIAALFGLIYKLLPDLPLEWRDVIPGALFTALLFSLGKLAIGAYLGRASIGSTYGAAGSLVVLLFWVYYSAQIFYLGAEFTQAYAESFGSRPCSRVRKTVQIVESPSAIGRPHDQPEERPAPSIEVVSSGKNLQS